MAATTNNNATTKNRETVTPGDNNEGHLPQETLKHQQGNGDRMRPKANWTIGEKILVRPWVHLCGSMDFAGVGTSIVAWFGTGYCQPNVLQILAFGSIVSL